MIYEFREAVRDRVHLLIGLAGASGSGKTHSAMAMAQGIVGREKRFAVIDTETGRAKYKAPPPGQHADFKETFRFNHLELVPPFRPDAYLEAIRAADKSGYEAIIVDSFSHVWDGEGGVLDWQEQELAEMVARAIQRRPDAREWELREAFKRSAWIKPKMAHKAMVQKLLQLRAHVILCLRAEDKIDFVKDSEGRTKVVPMQTLSGFKGWIPICDKKLPFELSASFVLTPDRPGVPQPIKLEAPHRPFFPTDQPLSEESGRRLAEWARGGAITRAPESAPLDDKKASLDAIRGFLSGLKQREARAAVCAKVFGVETWSEMTRLPVDRLAVGLASVSEGGPSKIEAACIEWKEAHTAA